MSKIEEILRSELGAKEKQTKLVEAAVSSVKNVYAKALKVIEKKKKICR